MSFASDQRGRIAAVFDIDGTLVPAPSLELRLLADFALARKLRPRAIGSWLHSLLSHVLGTSRDGTDTLERSLMLHQNKLYWEGVRVDAVDEWIAREFYELEFFAEALTIVDWHRRRGHAIVLISGTLAPLARAVGTLLTADGGIFVSATELECESGRWTGRVDGEAICGPAKERTLKRLARENNFDLSRSYAYADSLKDRWLLSAVGHPIAVNPGARLAQLARRRGWRLTNWNGRSSMPVVQIFAENSGARNDGQVLAEKPLWK
jgi:fatty acyl-CoA reductase